MITTKGHFLRLRIGPSGVTSGPSRAIFGIPPPGTRAGTGCSTGACGFGKAGAVFGDGNIFVCGFAGRLNPSIELLLQVIF
jgi:hypothetical protein